MIVVVFSDALDITCASEEGIQEEFDHCVIMIDVVLLDALDTTCPIEGIEEEFDHGDIKIDLFSSMPST